MRDNRDPGSAGGVTTCAIGPSGGPGGQGGDGRIYVTGARVEETGEYRGRPLVATAANGSGRRQRGRGGFGMDCRRARRARRRRSTARTGPGRSRHGGSRGATVRQGGPGQPGQGGGGGEEARRIRSAGWPHLSAVGSLFYTTATGGGGGGGGCGGQPGTPATGGGASIGALVIASGVTFERTRIETSEGAAQEKETSAPPEAWEATGGLGTVTRISTTGKGGDGGRRNGGASGHGAPGPSIALAYSKTKPSMTEVDLAPGPAGEGQPQLSRVVGGTVGTKLLPAVTGESKAEHEITQ